MHEKLESLDPSKAIASYVEAVSNIDRYAYIDYEFGFIIELKRELRPICNISSRDLAALDRLTLLHEREARYRELVTVIDIFAAKHPLALSGQTWKRILKRREKSLSKS